LISIFFCGFCFSAVFGRVIVSTFREVGGDLVPVDARRQLERALERAVGAPGKVIILVLLLALFTLEDERF
jgi:hypothetical protein